VQYNAIIIGSQHSLSSEYERRYIQLLFEMAISIRICSLRRQFKSLDSLLRLSYCRRHCSRDGHEMLSRKKLIIDVKKKAAEHSSITRKRYANTRAN